MQDVDAHAHEAKQVVEQLLKGPNMNFLIGVTSPEQIHTTTWGDRLLDLVKDHPAKGAFHSIRGMARSNLAKYRDKEKGQDEIWGAQKIVRALRLGQTYLETGNLVFPTVDEEVYFTTCDAEIKRLEDAYEQSDLPESMPEEPFRHWLLDLRLARLRQERGY